MKKYFDRSISIFENQNRDIEKCIITLESFRKELEDSQCISDIKIILNRIHNENIKVISIIEKDRDRS